MKNFLALALLAVSFSSQAVVVARLTNTECVSADGEQTIIAKYDSSKSMFGPQLLQVNGSEARIEVKKGNLYKVTAGDETHIFELKEGKEFTTILESKSTDLNEERAEASLLSFDLGGEKTELLCTTTTKFRVKK